MFVSSSFLQPLKNKKGKKKSEHRKQSYTWFLKKFLDCCTFISCFLPSFLGNFFLGGWHNFKQRSYNSIRNSCIFFAQTYQWLTFLSIFKITLYFYTYTIHFPLKPLSQMSVPPLLPNTSVCKNKIIFWHKPQYNDQNQEI